MTNPIHYQNQSIPAYSGVTINITNPTLNAAPLHQKCSPDPNGCYCFQQPQFSVQQNEILPCNYSLPSSLQAKPVSAPVYNQGSNLQNAVPQYPVQSPVLSYNDLQNNANIQSKNGQPNYPPQYYLNNYNYIQNGENITSQIPALVKNVAEQKVLPPEVDRSNYNIVPQEEDLSSSQSIKDELDSRLAEQKELEKSGKKTNVVALTNEYIMSLENYLNNPNTEIRLMASKEILTRLDEDKDRYDDAALNALLNKMLQDPERLIRIAALSAFSSQLASGNEYTYELLNNIQNDPNADKEDVVQAADCLLKMSSTKETKFIPAEKQYVQPQQVEGRVE